MNTKLSITILVLSVLFISSNEIYACAPPNQSPSAQLSADLPNAKLYQVVTLDGSDSYDSDGSITKYEWDFDYNDVSFDCDYYETSSYYPDGAFDGITTHAYDSNGTYTAVLRVTDNDSATDTDTDTVYVHVIDTFYVDTSGDDNYDGTSWATAFATIQRGVNEADYYDIVEVNEGTYYGPVDFNGVWCTVTGTDPNDWDVVAVTVIDANSLDANVVTFENSEIEYSVLRGFTITGGVRGIYCDTASPTITNCVIKGNDANGNDGGGIYIVDSSPAITNCFIVDNDANYGGGIYNLNSLPVLTNCVIADNTADANGGGIYNDSSLPRLVNSTIGKNNAVKGGGIYSYESSPIVKNSVIWDNSATDGNSIYNLDLNYPDDTNFVAWWKFDDNDGNTAFDSIGDNNGTLAGDANWADGLISEAISFDGDGDYVLVPDSDSISVGNGSYTLSAWIYPHSIEGYSMILSKAKDWSDQEYSLVVNNGKLRLYMEKDNNNQGATSGKAAPVTIGSWQHIAVTFESSTTTPVFYYNGAAIQTFDYITTLPDQLSDDLYIGRFGGGQGYDFDGVIDDVRIYNRALDANEVRALASCISYSDIEGSGGSGSWDPNFGADYGGNIDSDPCFVDSADPDGDDNIFGTTDDGLWLSPESPCIDAADGDAASPNDIIDLGRIDVADVNNTGTGDPNYVDMGDYEFAPTLWSEPNVVYVNKDATGAANGSCWADAYTTIAAGISEASPGEEIWVAKGTYTLTLKIDVNKVVELCGGFDANETRRDDRDWKNNVTTIDGDNSVICLNVTANATIDGFTITKGTYGIYIDGASPIIRNCVISNSKSQ